MDAHQSKIRTPPWFQQKFLLFLLLFILYSSILVVQLSLPFDKMSFSSLGEYYPKFHMHSVLHSSFGCYDEHAAKSFNRKKFHFQSTVIRVFFCSFWYCFSFLAALLPSPSLSSSLHSCLMWCSWWYVIELKCFFISFTRFLRIFSAVFLWRKTKKRTTFTRTHITFPLSSLHDNQLRQK